MRQPCAVSHTVILRRRARRARALAAPMLAGVLVLAAGTTAGAAPSQAALERGIVDLTVRTSDGGSAAGTGIITGRDGVIITNHHVIRGATRITVRVVRTNRRYAATVLGTDRDADIAVIKVAGPAFVTARMGDSASLRVGAEVIAAGNANGSGGRAEVSFGTVTRLNRAVTVGSTRGERRRLVGVIQTTTRLAPGQSGGPLYNAAGRVVGMNAAASFSVARGFAIPINQVLRVVREVRAGQGSDRIRIGPTGFLGVQLSAASGGDGARLAGVVDGGPAARAGLRGGDRIVALDGTRVASGEGLAGLISRRNPGDVVRVRWVTAADETREADITLAEGPVA